MSPDTMRGRPARRWMIGLAILAGGLATASNPAVAFEVELGRKPSTVAAQANQSVSPAKPPETARGSRDKTHGGRLPKASPPKATAESSREAGDGPDPAADGGGEIQRLMNLAPKESRQYLQTMAIFALASLAPAGLLMLTAFVRINIVLMLLRQALGSPQIPGNQVITALALMLTLLVMEPVGEKIYREAIVPLSAQKMGAEEALAAGMRPVKSFMIDQIERTNHQEYLWTLYDEAVPHRPDRIEQEYVKEIPFRVLAPAFLLSELTTALLMGFFLYLPFLVIDLVVSSVLAAMGLFMLPPTSIAMPVKLILFVLADGWLYVSKSLLTSFTLDGSH